MNGEREVIHKRTKHKHYLYRIKAGYYAIRVSIYKRVLLCVYLLIAALVWMFQGRLLDTSSKDVFAAIAAPIRQFTLAFYIICGLLLLLVLFGTPWCSRRVKEGMQKIGLTNHAGETPALLARSLDKKMPKLTVWEFDASGIPLEDWEAKRAGIETALNVTIAKIEQSEGRKVVKIYTVPAVDDFPTVLPWKAEYLSTESFVLILGESLTGTVAVNLAHIPHVLLGGSTGSGKSVLLKLLLKQAYKKGAEIYIADFKGGVDFPRSWQQWGHMILDEQTLLDNLSRIERELENRKLQFNRYGCANIDEYNKVTGEELPRLIVACDEVAELLDKTGRNKADKELLGQIEGKLSLVARQGRAFGVHLILATQRPDATIIPGQIRNNIDFRVCGRADSVLSKIILDNTSAADLIPKSARGRFVTGDGTVFQAYYMDEET